MQIIIIFGAPGSGKGTQAKLLAQSLNYQHFSTGDHLRKEIASNSEIGKKVLSYTNKGTLVPDTIISDIVTSYIENNKSQPGIILDGYPRTLKQLKILLNLLDKIKIQDIIILNIKISEEEITTRLLKRAKLENRPDDNLDTIKNRLAIYNKESQTILDYIKDKFPILDIDGQGSIEEIQARIKSSLK